MLCLEPHRASVYGWGPNGQDAESSCQEVSARATHPALVLLERNAVLIAIIATMKYGRASAALASWEMCGPHCLLVVCRVSYNSCGFCAAHHVSDCLCSWLIAVGGSAGMPGEATR